MNEDAIIAPFAVPFVHRLHFTENAFSPENGALDQVLREGGSESPLAVAFFDQGVADAWPDIQESAAEYAKSRDWKAFSSCSIQGGEQSKNDPAILERILQTIHDAGVDRQSYVIAVGGGALLDTVGYAAAIAHRGVRLVRVPTTTLAQADSGVGIKNGVNAFGKKNYLGVFSSPWAVVNDESLLSTLSDRDWRCGFAEAVKVGLIKDAALFETIAAQASQISKRQLDVAIPVIRKSAELHLRHITEGGDPFELVSARPLDFGHWAAHKLEQMTRFRLRHGEAVAIGLALDTLYSVETGLLPEAAGRRVLDCLAGLGFSLYDEAMADTTALLRGLDEFREHLGGELTIAMLTGIGAAINIHEMPPDAVVRSIERLAALRS